MSYLLKGQRYLRKYTEKTPSPVYAANIQAAEIVKSLCTVPWEPVAVEDAEMTSHSSEIVDKERSLTGLDWNVENRDLFDAALFCGEHVGGKHRAFANAAVYRYVLPDDAVGRILTSLSCTVTSDPYNALGARVHVFTNSTGVIPMNCHDLRGEDASGYVIANGTTAAGVAPRTVDGSGSWFAASERCTLSMGGMSGGGLVMAKYLFIAVTLENYNAWRGNWLEGSSYMENLVEINTDVPIVGLVDDPAVNDCSMDADNPEHSYEVVKGAVVPSVASDDVGTPLYHVTLARNGDKLQTPVTEMMTDTVERNCNRIQKTPFFNADLCTAQFAVAYGTDIGRRTFQNLDFLIYNAITGKPIVTDLDLPFDASYFAPKIDGINRVEIVPRNIRRVSAGAGREWTFEINVVIDSSDPEFGGRALTTSGHPPTFTWSADGLLGEGSITVVDVDHGTNYSDHDTGLRSMPCNLSAKLLRVAPTETADTVKIYDVDHAVSSGEAYTTPLLVKGPFAMVPMVTRALGLEFALIGSMTRIAGEDGNFTAVAVRATLDQYGHVNGWSFSSLPFAGRETEIDPHFHWDMLDYAFPRMRVAVRARYFGDPDYYDTADLIWLANPWKYTDSTVSLHQLEYDEASDEWRETALPKHGFDVWRGSFLFVEDGFLKLRHPKLAADVTAADAAIGLRMAYGCVYEGRVEPIQTERRFGAAFSLSQATTVRLLDSIGETMTVPCWQIVMGALVVPFACPLDFVAKAIRLDWTQNVSSVFNSGAKVFVYLNRGSFESGHTLELKQKSDFWTGGTAVAPYEKIATIENLQSTQHLTEVIKIAPLTSRVATLVFTAGFSADDRNPPLSELTRSGGHIGYDLSTGKVIANYDGNSAGFRPDITLIG